MDMTVADKVKARREELGLSQEELASRLGLKSRSSITRLEKLGDDISMKDVERLSEALNCSKLFLMGWQDDPNVTELEREHQLVALYSQLKERDKELIDSMLKTLLSRE